jgi:hypothetical protein
MNSIVLSRGSAMDERLHRAARQWTSAGRDPALLLGGTAFFLAQCWLYSSGAHQTESPLFRQEVADYVAASKTALGGEAAWNAMLNQRAGCTHCMMTFRLENLGICADCTGFVCPSCKAIHTAKCPGEVVG